MILVERNGLKALPARWILRAAQRARAFWWALATPETRGARAVCITPDGRIVLVRHSYLQGWFLPGGTLNAGESADSGLLRELSEEIGLVSHGGVKFLFEIKHRPNRKIDTQQVFAVHNTEIIPMLSWEIEAIGVCSPDALPTGTHPSTCYRVERWLNILRNGDREWTQPAPSET
jgi:ADP-ribose pyrophosphatase YjhB (NUDIX family)